MTLAMRYVHVQFFFFFQTKVKVKVACVETLHCLCERSITSGSQDIPVTLLISSVRALRHLFSGG